jgi:hypothetical protein
MKSCTGAAGRLGSLSRWRRTWAVGALLLSACGATESAAPASLEQALAVRYAGAPLGALLDRSGDSIRAQMQVVLAFRSALGPAAPKWLARAVAAGRVPTQWVALWLLDADLDAAKEARETLEGWMASPETKAEVRFRIARLLLEVDPRHAQSLQALREWLRGGRSDFEGAASELAFRQPLVDLLAEELLRAMEERADHGRRSSLVEFLRMSRALTAEQTRRLEAIVEPHQRFDPIKGLR